MTPIIVRDERSLPVDPERVVLDFESRMPHKMQLVRCVECGRTHLSVHPTCMGAKPVQCVFCREQVCYPITPAIPFPKRPGQSVYDALREMGARDMPT